MGAALAETFPAARAVFERADEVLGFALSRLCWEGPEEELRETQNAQPAILVHSYAVWAVVKDEVDGRVGYAAGHSLGEFSAYTAAGSLSLEDAVRLVRWRGELMAASRAGTMSAVVGLEPAQVEEICRSVAADGGVVVPANYNSPKQVVISGEAEAVARAGALAKEAGARMVRPLAVSGAFHSPLMADAETGLRAALESVSFRDPRFPVLSNVTAEPVGDAGAARERLLGQLTAPVRWTQSVQRMAGAGVSRFVELGPGKVLAGLLRRIDSRLECDSLAEPGEVQRFIEGAM
jgi:[acyl-carrier-protein] S-malonyltransferase